MCSIIGLRLGLGLRLGIRLGLGLRDGYLENLDMNEKLWVYKIGITYFLDTNVQSFNGLKA